VTARRRPSHSPPGAEEAAAIVAAVERFLRDHAAPAGAGEPPAPDPWRRAALLEGVRAGAGAVQDHPWINT
jgi:hypothetical protein